VAFTGGTSPACLRRSEGFLERWLDAAGLAWEQLPEPIMPQPKSQGSPPMNAEETDQERHLFRFLMENIPDRIYFKDRESRFICVNAAMARLFQLGGPHEAIGRIDSDFFPKADAQRMYEDEQRVVKTGEPLYGKVERKILPDGSTGWTLTTKLPLRGEGGEIIGTCGMSRDITPLMVAETALEQERNRLKELNSDFVRSQALLERKLGELEKANTELKAAQKRLIEAEKAQSIARLAIGVAHEVKNPLAILKMGADFFASQPAVNENALAVAKEMSEAVLRADSIINEMMAFSDSTDLKLSPVQVAALVDAALKPFEARLAAAKIRVEKRYATDMPAARIDEKKIKRVFSCLIENALDSMAKGGTLSIRLGLTHIAAPGVMPDRGNRSLTHSGVRRIGVIVEFDDTGTGIPHEKLDSIFDPFFTTKPTGQGTGLGLTVSRKVVELHGGTLDISNRSEGGVSAKVLLKV
jgi:PAS domain S-box-containing protein